MLFRKSRPAIGGAVIAIIAVVIIVVAAVGIYLAIGSTSPGASTSASSTTSTTTTPSPTTSKATSSSTTSTTTSTTSSTSSSSTSSSTTTSTTSSSTTTTSSTAAGFAFSLTSNPSNILINPGNNLTYASIGFILLPSAQTSGSEQVNFTVSSPSGLTIKLASQSAKITLGVNTQPTVGFTITAAQSLAPMKYHVNVTGTSGPVTENLTFDVNVVQYLVIAQGNHFGPSTLTVKTGSTVYWLNLDTPSQDPEVHNVIFQSGGTFHSNDISPSPSYGSVSYTFTAAGSYQYFCAYHPGMMATITVTA